MAELTLAELEELERLEREATPGYWRAQGDSDGRPLIVASDAQGARGAAYTWLVADAELLAAARNALPALLAAARELAELKSALEHLLVRDNWFFKNTCGISFPAESTRSILSLARERGWTQPGEQKGEEVTNG